MTERIIDFLDALVATVGAVDRRYCLVEKRADVNGTNIPYKYKGNGNYEAVNVDGGSVSYWRIVNSISFDVVDGNKAVKNLQATYPIRYVAMVRRDDINPLTFSQDVANLLEGRNKDLQTQLQAKNVNITVGSIDTDTVKIWGDEFSVPLSEPNYTRSMVMIDLTVTVIAARSCWESCDDFPDILQGFDWCDPSTYQRLTPAQITCLEGFLCGTCEDATVQLNGTTVGTIASGATESFTVNLDGSPSGVWDGTAWQVTSAPCDDATIELNGVEMTTIPSGDTENISVRQSSGATEVGSKQGTHWRIDDSAISINGSPVADVKAEDSLDIDVTQDGSPVGSWNGSAWIVPPCVAPTLNVGVFSDSGATTPITSSDYGTTIYIKATATATQENFTLFIDNGLQSALPVVEIDNSATHVFEYTINITGTLDIYVIASDNTNGIADSEPFEFTVTGIYPPSIAGNVLWVDASFESSYVLNGTFVQQLNDLSGLSNHLSAPSVGNQPAYLDVPNGINGLRSTQYSSGKYLRKLGLSLDIISGSSIFIVVKFYASANGALISTDNTYNGASGYMALEQNGLNIRSFASSGGYTSSYPILLNTNYLIEVHRTPSQERLILNGVTLVTRAIGTAGNRTNFWVNTGFAGQPSATWGDIAVFNTIISPTNETDLRNFLMTKWNIV